jgi:hypothetical protein
MKKYMPSKILGGETEKRKPFLYMAIHESLFCHLKPNNCMLMNELYYSSSLRWIREQ